MSEKHTHRLTRSSTNDPSNQVDPSNPADETDETDETDGNIKAPSDPPIIRK